MFARIIGGSGCHEPDLVATHFPKALENFKGAWRVFGAQAGRIIPLRIEFEGQYLCLTGTNRLICGCAVGFEHEDIRLRSPFLRDRNCCIRKPRRQ